MISWFVWGAVKHSAFNRSKTTTDAAGCSACKINDVGWNLSLIAGVLLTNYTSCISK